MRKTTHNFERKLSPAKAMVISMVIDTIRFGKTKVRDESVLTFAEGLLGFEECKRFVIAVVVITVKNRVDLLERTALNVLVTVAIFE